jgi:hypothetical protein
MGGPSNLNWNGDAITARLKAAQIEGINGTMGACVNQAKRSHAWQNRSGILEGGIGIVEFAEPAGSGVRGVWGVQDVRYALIHELGGVITPLVAKVLAFELNGQLVFARSVTIPARPYLRPAADAIYPSLARRIKRAYQAGGGDE